MSRRKRRLGRRKKSLERQKPKILPPPPPPPITYTHFLFCLQLQKKSYSVVSVHVLNYMAAFPFLGYPALFCLVTSGSYKKKFLRSSRTCTNYMASFPFLGYPTLISVKCLRFQSLCIISGRASPIPEIMPIPTY